MQFFYKSFSENKEYLCTINFKLGHQHEKSNLFIANRGALVGYTLTLSDREDSYTYYITGTTLSVPQGISGEYELTITNGNIWYQGDIIF